MNSLPEQFFAARKWPLEVQIDFFQAVTTQVFQSAEKVIALNIDTSRAAVERSSNAVKQLFSITDPRDLFALGSQGQEQFQQMIAYSRELFGIAAGAQNSMARQAGSAQPTTAAAPTAAAAPATATAPATASAPAGPAQPAHAAAEEAQQAKGVKPSKKPVVATAPEPEEEPASRAKPIARAAGKLAPKSTAVQHPLASPVVLDAGQVELPQVKPVEAAPPPAPVSGTPEIESKQAQLATLKGDRKK